MVDDNMIGNGKGWLLSLSGVGVDADASLMQVRAGAYVQVRGVGLGFR